MSGAFAKLPGQEPENSGPASLPNEPGTKTSHMPTSDGISTSQHISPAAGQSANSLPTLSASVSAVSANSAPVPETKNPVSRRETGPATVLGAGIEPATRGFSVSDEFAMKW